MSTIGTLAVGVVANMEGFTRGMRSGRNELSLFGSGIDKVKGMVIGFGASIAAAFTVSALKGAAEEINRMAKDAVRLGIATDKLQGLERFGDLAGASAESVVSGIGKMEVAISKGVSSFGKLKLSALELKALKPEEAFYKIADAIKAIPNAADRMKAVKEIFGKGGASLLPTIMQGGAAIKGGVGQYGNVTDEQAKGIEAANDAAKELSFAFTDLKNIIVTQLAPGLTDLLKTTTGLLSGKPNSNGVYANGLLGTAGTTEGAHTSEYDSVLGKMSDADFKKLQHDFKQKDHDLAKGIGAPVYENSGPVSMDDLAAGKGGPKRISGKTLSEFTQESTGVSGFDYTTFVTAMDKRQDKINQAIQAKHKDAGLDKPVDYSLGKYTDAGGPLSDSEQQRIKNAVEEFNLTNKGREAPEAKQHTSSFSNVAGFGALEAGSAAAFSQERRSTLAASPGVAIAKTHLDEAKKQSAKLDKIEQSTKKAAEFANFELAEV